jgi:ABC-type polysaccharide/polyol phosphate transport system ATPase subunit
MSDDMAIKVQNLTKVYKLYDTPFQRLKEALNPLGRSYHKDFYALRDVDLEVKKGDTVGIIGQNGAGKSTLLKIITGIITPTSGSTTVTGKISALLELGAGFNPQISGLENVYFNGTLIGFSKEKMDEKIDDILSFADIGEFIHQPVRTYSSGMFVRLAFAVAVHIEPEILIVDEALSVGDVMFQSKCFEKIKSLMAGGVTTLFVTHNMNTVAALCNKAYLIDGGRICSVGSPKEVTLSYYRLQREREHARKDKSVAKTLPTDKGKPEPVVRRISARAQTQPGEERFGLGTAKIVDFIVLNHEGVETDSLEAGRRFKVKVDIEFSGNVKNPAVGVMFKTPQGQALLGIHSYHGNRINYGPKNAGDRLTLTFESVMCINPGKYLMNIGIADHETDLEYNNIDSRHNIAAVNVIGKDFPWGMIHNSGIVIEE